MEFIAEVDVMLKEGIADPQGQTIERSLPALGYEAVRDVRVGKHITLRIEAEDDESAARRVTELCDVLLANPVIESYSVDIAASSPDPVPGGST